MKAKKFQKAAIILFSFFISLQVLIIAGNTIRADEEKQRVYDEAGLLTASEINEIEKKSIKAENKIKTELYIVTTENTDGKTSEEYASDFGNKNGFGYEKPRGSYVILLIDMQNRNIWISTSGAAKTGIAEDELESILDEVFQHITKEDYYHGCLSYLKITEKYLKDTNLFSNPFLCLGIAAAAGGIVTGVLYSQASSKMTAQARDYQVQGKFRVNQKSDLYVRTTVKTRKIETAENSQKAGRKEHNGSKNGGGGRHF